MQHSIPHRCLSCSMKFVYKTVLALTTIILMIVLPVLHVVPHCMEEGGQPVTGHDLGLADYCRGSLKLTTDIPVLHDGEQVNNLFFLETSGRPTLNLRQACAIESAARMSEMDVIVAIKNETLSLNNNITCQLIKRYSNIQFYR